MKTNLFICLSSALLISCANWSGKPNQNLVGENGERQLIVKSGLFEKCGHFDNGSVGQESAIGAMLAAAAIQKVAEITVEAFSTALNEAAEKRNDAFTLKGKSADWLYKAGSNPPSIQRCLVVVAGVKQVSQDPCTHKDSKWYKEFPRYACGTSEIPKAMQAWGIEKPAMYAEILLFFPDKGSPSYVTPKLVYSYYPEPLSSHKAKDLKNTLVSIKATSPGAKNPTFEIVFKGQELAPGKHKKVDSTPNTLKAAEDSGEWLVLPGDLTPASTSGKGGALNIETLIIETPEPNKIIAMTNEIIKEKKPELTEAANAKLSYALLSDARATQRSANAEKDEASDFAAITACKALEASIQGAKDAKANLAKDSGNSALTIAHKESCLTVSANQRKASELWEKSSYDRDPALCFSNTLSTDLSAACP